MAKIYKLEVDIEKMNLYEMKELLKLILEKLSIEIGESEMKDSIKKYFKEKT